MPRFTQNVFVTVALFLREVEGPMCLASLSVDSRGPCVLLWKHDSIRECDHGNDFWPIGPMRPHGVCVFTGLFECVYAIASPFTLGWINSDCIDRAERWR